MDIVRRLEEGGIHEFRYIGKPFTYSNQTPPVEQPKSTLSATRQYSCSHGNNDSKSRHGTKWELKYNGHMMPSPVHTGNLLPNTTRISSGMQNGSLGSSDGGLMNDYQQSTSNFSSGNSFISSMGAQRMDSQMIPTPRFNNSNTNQSYMNKDMSNNK
ncbi:hypothetical protein Lser_V15G40255 [Lactuca serriola]